MNFISRLLTRREDRVNQLEQQIINLEGDRDRQGDMNDKARRDAQDERRELKRAHEDSVHEMQNTIKRLERKAEMIDEELLHLVKIKESKLDIEFKEKVVALQIKTNDEVAKIKAEYQEKLEGHLNVRIAEQTEMYAELLARLPNIEVALKGRVGN